MKNKENYTPRLRRPDRTVLTVVTKTDVTVKTKQISCGYSVYVDSNRLGLLACCAAGWRCLWLITIVSIL